MLMSEAEYERAQTLAAGISLGKRMNAIKSYQAGEKLEKKGQVKAAYTKYEESLNSNPYYPLSLAKIISRAMGKKAYKEAAPFIARGLIGQE